MEKKHPTANSLNNKQAGSDKEEAHAGTQLMGVEERAGEFGMLWISWHGIL